MCAERFSPEPRANYGSQSSVTFRFFGRAQEIMKCKEMKADFRCGDYTALTLKLAVLKVFPQLVPIGNAMEVSLDEQHALNNDFVNVKTNNTISITPHSAASEEVGIGINQEKGSVNFLFFGVAGELVRSSITEDFPCGDYTDLGLKLQVLRSFPSLEPLKNSFILALNEEYVTENETVHLKDGDTVAVIPPLSGG